MEEVETLEEQVSMGAAGWENLVVQDLVVLVMEA